MPLPFWARIIPAYAGSTVPPALRRRAQRDHPRIRGEHPPSDGRRRGRGGSSPHTRGALMRLLADEDAVGIIPAYAGSTDFSPSTSGAAADHPRIRGEHHPRHVGEGAQVGSSPHTRGARARRRSGPARRGIIPAYAGSTFRRRRRWCCWRDHPRIRGEHGLHQERPRGPGGSSPHTRGAQSFLLLAVV